MKTDVRVRYTRMRIREAFLECLEKKHVSKITVKEICDRAEINRATFYKHYADPFELLQRIEEDELDSLRLKIEAGRQGMPQGVLLTVVKGMKEAGSPHALLASSNGDPSFAARISELFYNAYRPRLAQNLPECTEAEADMAYLFISGGCGHLISSWIREGCRHRQTGGRPNRQNLQHISKSISSEFRIVQKVNYTARREHLQFCKIFL